MDDNQTKLCPRCNKEYEGSGSMSRRNNDNICDSCSENEAIEDFYNNCIT